MGQPDWSAIPQDKWPDWKKQEAIELSKQTIATLETKKFKCEVCGKICKSRIGLVSHSKSHNKLN